jgi:hypothetical protein
LAVVAINDPQAPIHVSVEVIDFGSVEFGAVGDTTFTTSNTGGAPLNVTSIQEFNPSFQILTPYSILFQEFPGSINIPYNAIMGTVETILGEGQVPVSPTGWGNIKALYRQDRRSVFQFDQFRNGQELIPRGL